MCSISVYHFYKCTNKLVGGLATVVGAHKILPIQSYTEAFRIHFIYQTTGLESRINHFNKIEYVFHFNFIVGLHFTHKRVNFDYLIPVPSLQLEIPTLNSKPAIVSWRN